MNKLINFIKFTSMLCRITRISPQPPHYSLIPPAHTSDNSCFMKYITITFNTTCPDRCQGFDFNGHGFHRPLTLNDFFKVYDSILFKFNYFFSICNPFPSSLYLRPPFSTHLRCPSCTQPTAHPWRCGPGVGAHAQSVGREVLCTGGGLGCW